MPYTFRGRRPVAKPAKPVVAPAPSPADYEALKKDELVAAAAADGLPTSGTKADLIERLVETQEAVEEATDG